MILRYWNTGTSDEAGGFPNVEFNPDYSVEGCVYAITETELCMLDNCMGYPKVSGKKDASLQIISREGEIGHQRMYR